MKNTRLTVLTEPVPKLPAGPAAFIKSALRPLKYFLIGKPRPVKKKFGGHQAVTRSLLEGLRTIRADFNYNPANDDNIFENVIVLSGPETLRKAISLKEHGKIKFLLAGPNISDSVLDEDQIVGHPAVDFFVVPASWVEFNVVKQLPVLENRVLCWPAGVNTANWTPQKKASGKNVVVYWKTEDEQFCGAVEDVLKGHGYTPIRIRYGNYHPSQYRTALNASDFAVFISRSESQGMALAEAWAMEVPTLVWDPGELTVKGTVFEKVSACPYLSAETGKRWVTIEELDQLVATYSRYSAQFKPRAYTIGLFSDEVCAQALLNFISLNTKH
jgi:hypothetical protein